VAPAEPATGVRAVREDVPTINMSTSDTAQGHASELSQELIVSIAGSAAPDDGRCRWPMC
jgi:hypothetical protein